MKFTLSYTVAVYILQNNIDYKKSPKVRIPTDLIDLLDKLKNLSSRDGIKLAVGTSKELLDYYCKNRSDWDDALVCASEGGYLDMIKYSEKQGAGASLDSLNRALACASQEGHLDIVKYYEEERAGTRLDWNWVLVCASYGGHIKIIQYCEEKGASASLDTWKEALDYALYEGHIDTVKYCCEEKGADSSLDKWNEALFWALKKGYLDIVKYCEKKLDQHNVKK